MSKVATYQRRCLCYTRLNRQEDTSTLADALGLLSPKRNDKSKNAANYRPLLLRNLQKGPVQENYNEIKKELMADFKIPTTDHSRSVNHLLMDLQAATERRSVLQSNLLNHVRTLKNEDELLELIKLLYYQNRLGLPLLTTFILNRNLRRLDELPFDVENLDRGTFAKSGWKLSNFAEFRILLLKKYHDLNMPTKIIKSLKGNFDEYAKLIAKHKLSPFYERIVWKFYFEYIQQLHPQYNEEFWIAKLDSVRSSFLIWEASLQNNSNIVNAALRQHSLSPLQKAFFQLCSCEKAQLVISHELKSGKSSLLSSLKKLSVKFKMYDVGNTSESQSVATRALGYSIIHALENTIKSNFANWKDDKQLEALMDDFASQRTHMVLHEPQEGIVTDGIFT